MDPQQLSDNRHFNIFSACCNTDNMRAMLFFKSMSKFIARCDFGVL